MQRRLRRHSGGPLTSPTMLPTRSLRWVLTPCPFPLGFPSCVLPANVVMPQSSVPALFGMHRWRQHVICDVPDKHVIGC